MTSCRQDAKSQGNLFEKKSSRLRAFAAEVRVLVWLIVTFVSTAAVGSAEIIDRVMAILPGQIVMLSDVEAALDFGIIEAPAGGDRAASALSALIDRMLMLGEVRRIAPPEPSAAAVEGRMATIRARFDSPAAFARAMTVRGIDETVLRFYASDDLRLSAYLDERFSAAAQPTDEEIRQAGESARAKLTAERRQTLIAAWIAELRRRAEVVIVQSETQKSLPR